MQKVLTRELSGENTLILLHASYNLKFLVGSVFQFNILDIQYSQLTGKINMGKDKFLNSTATEHDCIPYNTYQVQDS